MPKLQQRWQECREFSQTVDRPSRLIESSNICGEVSDFATDAKLRLIKAGEKVCISEGLQANPHNTEVFFFQNRSVILLMNFSSCNMEGTKKIVLYIPNNYQLSLDDQVELMLRCGKEVEMHQGKGWQRKGDDNLGQWTSLIYMCTQPIINWNLSVTKTMPHSVFCQCRYNKLMRKRRTSTKNFYFKLSTKDVRSGVANQGLAAFRPNSRPGLPRIRREASFPGTRTRSLSIQVMSQWCCLPATQTTSRRWSPTPGDYNSCY